MKVAKKASLNFKRYAPIFFTSLNALMGILVIYLMILDGGNGKKIYLPLMIIFAGICDCLDGRLARKFNADTLFGKELDSLADAISFSLAPVSLLINNLLEYTALLGLVAGITYPLADIYRLARFNASTLEGYFEGLPITIAGMILALKHLVIINLNLQASQLVVESYITSILMLALSYLMVSKIKFKKL